MILGCCRRYAAKWNVLEEMCKCELNAASAMSSHAASHEWLRFVDSQVSSSTPPSIVQTHQQIQLDCKASADGYVGKAAVRAVRSQDSVSCLSPAAGVDSSAVGFSVCAMVGDHSIHCGGREVSVGDGQR
ncbi:unnamed protein product [Toxocara canis]|uniref:Uncharacterized protein n=1 Tax=Toxocara canis TaxID=6265 RepID=A0A183U2C7_TOXCA|nr:unnamed protein product [Toxocara canis]